MFRVELGGDDFDGNGDAVKVANVAHAIAKLLLANGSANKFQAERDAWSHIITGITAKKLHPFNPATLDLYSAEHCADGIVRFDELVAWGQWCKRFNFVKQAAPAANVPRLPLVVHTPERDTNGKLECNPVCPDIYYRATNAPTPELLQKTVRLIEAGDTAKVEAVPVTNPSSDVPAANETKALIAKRQDRLERAITPQGCGSTRRHITPPAPATLPDWNYWKHSPKVEPWEACALALNIEPDSVDYRSESWDGQPETWRGFPSDEIGDHFIKLLRLLNSNQFERQHFTENFAIGVRLSEFAAWCAPVVRDLIGSDIPKELAAMAKDAPQAATAPNAEEVTVESQGGDDVEEQAAAADDHDETLAALFDPLPVEALAKMFMIDLAQWKKWQDKAAANGLIAARQGTALFNPYKAGVWFIRKGAEGWDVARLYRVLANSHGKH